MTSNQNKFIDRTPAILPAGKRNDNLGRSVADCMREYTISDAAAALKHVANVDESAARPTFKVEPYRNHVCMGVFTEIRPSLRPPVKTRYQTLINELKETTYDSHWNKVIGKGRDQTPGLPKGLDLKEHTFGKPTPRKESVRELVNPPKGVYQVLSESQEGHDMYRETHNDYNPGERVCRGYSAPSYDCNKRFGYRSKYDARGIWVRCACHWHNSEPTSFTSKIQADFLNKNRSQVGRVLTPNNNAAQLPKDFTYGKPLERDELTVGDLLKDADCPPCHFKRQLAEWLSSFNRMRISMKKRCELDFNLSDLNKKLLYYDRDKTGVLPLDVFYAVCNCYGFTFDRKNLEALLRLLGVVCEGNICYGRFLDMADSNGPPFELMKVPDVPEQNLYYLTTTQAAGCDCYFINNADMPTAGVPSVRHDLPWPVVPPGGTRADLANLGDESTTAILLSPTIYCSYGLSFRDFFMPRERHVIRTLFEKIGYKFDDATFEKLWSTALESDKTGLVCVDTFNKLLLGEYGEHKKLVVDEATC